VEVFYDFCPIPAHPAGKVLASTIIRSRRSFVKTEKFAALLETFPVFASDIALHYHKEKLFHIRSFKCMCGNSNLVRDSSVPNGIRYVRCSYCSGGHQNLGVSE
jgi:formate dehydrogenase maturation protein FdhE